MTAEIAILNRDAIALAADSAVTIETSKGRKIYNTSNKLFSLSKHAPVGVMIYGRSDLMGIPWESIIKAYRSTLSRTTFATIGAYADNFLKYLSDSRELFPRHQEDMFFRKSVVPDFLTIRGLVVEQIEEQLKKQGEVSFRHVELGIDEAIKAYEKMILTRSRLPHLKTRHANRLKARFKSLVASTARFLFEKLPLSQQSHTRLLNIAVEKWCRSSIGYGASGIVIAGFGSSEIFPSLRELQIDGTAEGIVRYDTRRVGAIDHGNTASILPFAQHEMVVSFMEGIDPGCRGIIESFWATILKQYPIDAVNSINQLSEQERDSIKGKLMTAGKRILEEFKNHLDAFQRKNHIQPVIDAVAVLPKDLLAEVAESLVNLTSFKRRISMDSAETVGGPIDVAVISRGDGFVWIKRKHYFKPELNPRFFASMLGGNHEKAQERET